MVNELVFIVCKMMVDEVLGCGLVSWVFLDKEVMFDVVLVLVVEIFSKSFVVV